jgi:hypothetical protein
LDINDAGVVVGYGMAGSTIKGFIYSNGQYTELWQPGWIQTVARAVNANGVAVGYGIGTGGIKGFIAAPKSGPGTTTTTIPGGTTTTTIPGGTTTTTISSGPCAAEAIYGENSEQTELLREYRDNVLSKTPEGQEIIKTYYKFSPTETKLLKQRP